MRYLTEADIEALEIGAAILGTGGGGNPYIGKLRTLQELRRERPIRLISLDELSDDALVATIGGIGAPVISVEKLEHGEEGCWAVRALEEQLGRKIDALVAAEIGGGNSMMPMITAAQLGIGVVDGDGMGRAFPEMQMTTFSIYGHRSVPAALADERGNVVLFKHTMTEEWFEKLARATTVAMGGSTVGVEAPMSGRYVKRAAVPGTVTQAITLGNIVLQANRKHADPIPLICSQEGGVHLMDGKIVDLKRHLRGGFSVGEIVLEGIQSSSGRRGSIVFQNEFLLLELDGLVRVSVPDLVVLLDVDSGHAITTDVLRYGQRVAVLGLPCHPLLRTPEALKVVGPAAFQLHDVEFKPLRAT
ncbi:MAG: DUF917 domain-containing protein [Proteobacteria bacterium]|nr:DUF917 domain-containing protein [Pseudomonadota bacterium]